MTSLVQTFIVLLCFRIAAGCNDVASCPEVCSFDTYCCDTAWDQQCIAEAKTVFDCDVCPTTDFPHFPAVEKKMPGRHFEDDETWYFTEGQDIIIYDGITVTNEETPAILPRKQSTEACPFTLAPQNALTNTFGAETKIEQYCKTAYGHTPKGDSGAIQFNSNKLAFTQANPLCVTPGATTYSKAKAVSADQTLATTTFDNTLSEDQSFSSTISGQYSVAKATSTSATLAIDASIEVGVNVEVAEAKSTYGVSFSVTTESSTTKTITKTYSATAQPKLPPGCKAEAKLTISASEFHTPFSVPMCYNGYVWCSYNYRVRGHYYWSAPLGAGETLQFCQDQTGSFSYSTKIVASIRYTALNDKCTGTL